MQNTKLKRLNAIFGLILLSISGMGKAENINVKFLFLGDVNSHAYQGVTQGLSEANLQGQFLGQNYEVTNIEAADLNKKMAGEAIAILVASDEATLRRIAKEHKSVPVMNLTATGDELRADCLSNTFHIPPSDLMKADALEQWKKKKPYSFPSAQAWHPDFKKFAARDLNKRFKKAHDTKMLDDAWAGWAAVKMISDAVARDNITESNRMLEFLKTELAFDGQKGINMSFRPTGQLRQPILIVEDDKILAEAPIRGVAKPPTVESLGLLDCQK